MNNIDVLKINEILFTYWDPIGVNECNGISDEYMRYAYDLLSKSSVLFSQEKIERYLKLVCIEIIELPPNEQKIKEAAKNLYHYFRRI